MTASDPDTRGKRLGLEPHLHPTAQVRDTTFGAYCEIGARTRVAECQLGDYSYVANDSDLIYTTAGKFCSIAAQVRLNPGNHPSWRAAQSHFTYRASAYGLGEDEQEFFDWRRAHRVTLGHDVWIGHGVTVLPGNTIGTGAIVGSGAVVTHDVPAYAVAVGVPAQVRSERFPEEIAAALQRIAWWDWPHERLGQALDDFRQLSAAAFCAKYDPAV